ncbi:unnamed protein product [Brassica rapa]|uniref:Uncharacterized protein n=1 Tax=Brassica campestris TaxID=3711 RepID=A0A8D9H9M4_BRACM|nr:unnamed protein product [Brassica rapa]
MENMFFLKDERSVCNAYNVSAVSLNPSIQEVEAFAKLLPKENISLATVQSKPLSMVSMMSEVNGKYRIYHMSVLE